VSVEELRGSYRVGAVHATPKRGLVSSAAALVRRVSDNLVNFVGAWEGKRNCPYQDVVGVWTICYGETEGVNRFTPCKNDRECRRMLRRALNHRYLPYVPRLARMKKQEADAMASFAYNLGRGVVSDPNVSSLARRLKSKEGRTFEGRKNIYRQELPKWVYAGGQKLEGLVKRRAAEVRIAVHGDYSGRP
jgi:lysozyme